MTPDEVLAKYATEVLGPEARELLSAVYEAIRQRAALQARLGEAIAKQDEARAEVRRLVKERVEARAALAGLLATSRECADEWDDERRPNETDRYEYWEGRARQALQKAEGGE